MPRKAQILLPATLALLVLGFFCRAPLSELLYTLETGDMFVNANGPALDAGPASGSTLPLLRANHGGKPNTPIGDFVKSNGLVIVSMRSLDWCPYCKRQLIELESYKPFFDAHAIGLVVMTYDPPEVQQDFLDLFDISVPVLSDQQSTSFRQLQILDPQYKEGDMEFGIPYPGLLVVNRQLQVAGKLYLKNPELRVEASEALVFARRALGLGTPFNPG